MVGQARLDSTGIHHYTLETGVFPPYFQIIGRPKQLTFSALRHPIIHEEILLFSVYDIYMRELTRKRQRFIAEYLKDQHGTNAAIRAGFSKKTAHSIASEYLQIPEIKLELEKRLNKIYEENGVEIGSVIRRLDQVANRCMQAEPVLGPFGIQRTNWKGEGVWDFDSSGANKALELLGKTKGAFVDKHDVTIGGKMIIVRPKR